MRVYIDLHADSVVAERGEMSVAVYQWMEASLTLSNVPVPRWRMNLHIAFIQHDQLGNQMTVIKYTDNILFSVI